MKYTIHPAARPPATDSRWEGAPWNTAATLTLDHFHARSSTHRPAVSARVLYDATHLHLMYRVEDRYVRCVRSAYQDSVCRDSCVEFFVQPQPDKGYFNFEFNVGGALLLYFIEDPERSPQGFRKSRPVDAADAAGIVIRSSMPARVEPEITSPQTWTLAARIPFALFQPYIGAVAPRPGDTWRANFYKCADETSHPHWASWAPIGEQLNFHVPQYFGSLLFA